MFESAKRFTSQYRPYLVIAGLAAVAALVGGWTDGLTILSLWIGIWILRQWVNGGDD